MMGEVLMAAYQKLQQQLNKHISKDIQCGEALGSVVLEGELADWQQVVEAGQLAAKTDYRGVINRLHLKEDQSRSFTKPEVISKELENMVVDVLVIGAGIIGSAIARQLSQYQLKVLVIDKEYDVAIHTSSRNDGMIHPGFAAKTGSLKSKYNVRGNAMYDQVAKDLDVPIRQVGSYILMDRQYLKVARSYFSGKCEKVGIEGVYKDKKALKREIPYLNERIQWGYFFPSTKVTSPYRMTVAYAENAVSNGVEFSLNTVALSMKKQNNRIVSVCTNKGTIHPKVVINAAGTFADIVADMAGDQFFTIHPRKGEVALLDIKQGRYLDTVIGKPDITFKARKSKGGGLVKTLEGNILVGPNNYEVEYREDYSTDRVSLNTMLEKQLPLINHLQKSDVITYFAGTRAATYKEDFIIERSTNVPNMIHVAGIQSPGFASAPAIAKDVEKLCVDYLSSLMAVENNPTFNPIRKAPPDLVHMDPLKRAKLIREHPDYGTIICRCEEISKGEIIDALRRPLPVDSVDGIKRRTRAGMGRCQGGFCLPHVMHIIEAEKHLNPTEVMKKSQDGQIVVEETKGEKPYV